jgi:hypothetical protein
VWVKERDLLGNLRRQVLVEEREQQVLLAAEVFVNPATSATSSSVAPSKPRRAYTRAAASSN